MSEAKRFSMMWGEDEGGCIYVRPFEHLHGDWVRHGDYAKLKADLEKSDGAVFTLAVENERLKAEVERLTQDLKDEKSANVNVEGRMQHANLALSMANHNLKAEVERLKAMDSLKTVSLTDSTNWQAIGDYAETKEENVRLKAEVARLRKAGDEMHRAIKVSDPILDWRIDQWNAAKEGKPTSNE